MACHPRSLVMMRIGGVEYPVKSVLICKTCQHPQRLKIEGAFVAGQSYPAILAMIEQYEDHGRLGIPSIRGLRTHFQDAHMPMQLAHQRQVIERRAEEMGRNPEEGLDTLADYVTANRMIVQHGFEAMQRGEIRVNNVGDLLRAIESLHKIESSFEGGVDTEVWVSALMAFSEVVRERVAPETWDSIGAALSQHPVIAGLAAKMAQQSSSIELR